MAAVQEAVTIYGVPTLQHRLRVTVRELEFTSLLNAHGTPISMDGKGSGATTMFVEPLWTSIKYEELYLHAYEPVSAAQQGLACYLMFYNQHRLHQALCGKKPDQVYDDSLTTRLTV